MQQQTQKKKDKKKALKHKLQSFKKRFNYISENLFQYFQKNNSYLFDL